MVVTALTPTPGKTEAARAMGASAACLWQDAQARPELKNRFDLIISTVPCPFEVEPFMQMLKLDSTCINVGLGEARGLSAFSMAFGRKSLVGSMTGGIAETSPRQERRHRSPGRPMARAAAAVGPHRGLRKNVPPTRPEAP